MKVTQVLYSGLGGHGGVAFSLLAGDRTQAWSPSLIFVGIEPLRPSYAQTCRRLGIPYESIQTTAGQPWKSWPALFAALRKQAPDAVILHSPSSLPVCSMYCRSHRRPLISVEHTAVHLKRRSELLMGQLSMILSQRVVVLTEQYKREYAEACGAFYRESKTTVIPNAVDTQLFSPANNREEDPTTIRLGMAARFSPQKRQDVLVSALVWLRQKRPEVSWHLSLAGDGEQAHRVKTLAAHHDLGNAIEFCGVLDDEQLASWFRGLDLYLHPSEGEALSISLLQAMASGTPIVASNVPGISNLLAGSSKPLGVLVADNKGAAFGRAVLQLYQEPLRAKHLAEVAMQHVCTHHSSDVMFRNYDRLLQCDTSAINEPLRST